MEVKTFGIVYVGQTKHYRGNFYSTLVIYPYNEGIKIFLIRRYNGI